VYILIQRSRVMCMEGSGRNYGLRPRLFLVLVPSLGSTRCRAFNPLAAGQMRFGPQQFSPRD